MRKTDQVSQDFAQVFPNRPLLTKLDPGYAIHSSIAAVFSVPIAGFSSGQPVFDPGYPFRLGRILRVSSRRPQSGNLATPMLSTRPELIPTQRKSIGIARKMRKKPSRTSAKFRLWILNARYPKDSGSFGEVSATFQIRPKSHPRPRIPVLDYLELPKLSLANPSYPRLSFFAWLDYPNYANVFSTIK